MKKHIDKLNEFSQKLIKTGFFSIYISTILAKVITLFCGILLVRLMTQEEYGTYALILNAFSMSCIFGDFGSSSASLQFSIENHKNSDKQSAFYKYGIKIALIASFISILMILLSRFYYPFQSMKIANYTMVLFLIPILTNMINFINISLRIKEENNKYSLFQILTTIIHYVIILPMVLFYGLLGAITSQYIYNFLILITGLYISKRVVKFKKTDYKLGTKEKKDFLKLSLGSQIYSTLLNLLYTINIFILGIMMIDTNHIAIYKVATVIPTALAFLPQCLSIYVMPYFIKNNQNIKWIKTNSKKIAFIGFICYSFIALILILFSGIIIKLLYGAKYIGAILPFNILLIGFIFNSAIKIPYSNIIYSMRKIKVNIIISIISLLMSFTLNIIFIKIYGYVGAAIVTTLISIMQSMFYIFYMKKILKEKNLTK